MSRNIITYNLNSEVATVNGVHLDKEQSIEITKIIDEKDQRIAELEKENEEKEDKILDLKSYNSDLKETISKLSFSAVRCQAINDEVCQYILDNELLKKRKCRTERKTQRDKRRVSKWNLIYYIKNTNI